MVTKFTQDDINCIKAVCEKHDRMYPELAEYFDTTSTTIFRINKNMQCAEYCQNYDALSQCEKDRIREEFLEKSRLLERKLEKTAFNSRRTLTKEQIFIIYIYDEYGNNKPCFVSRDFEIANCNTLRCIRRRLSYKNYSNEYEKLSIDDKLKILCHYMETYNRKPPELLEHLIKDNQQPSQ